jgi:hypothetical protein
MYKKVLLMPAFILDRVYDGQQVCIAWRRQRKRRVKAFWDVGHAPKDQSNRRSHQPGYAAWEIHPVIKLEVVE